LWDTVAGRLLRSLNGASTQMMALAFSPDGRMLVSSHLSGEDGVVALWPTRLREEISAVRGSSIDGRAILFDRDGSRFYACALQSAGAWDPRGRGQQWKYITDTRLIEHLAVPPTDGSVFLSELDRPTFTHVSSTGEPLKPFGTNSASSLEFSRSGRLLLTVDSAHSYS